VAVREVLAGPVRRGRVLGAFPRAVYVAVGAEVVAVVAAGGLRLPVALVLEDPAPLPALRPGTPALVGDGTVAVGGLRATVTSWWDPRPRVGPVVPAAVEEARAALAASPSAVAAHLPALAAALGTPGADAAADRLVGLGPGLTPAGDDVLAGTLAALHLFGGPPLRVRAAGRTTTLSAALLACAARGEVLAQAATLLRALAGDGAPALAALTLTRVGHTSGRDLAAGLLLGAGATAAGPRVTAPPGVAPAARPGAHLGARRPAGGTGAAVPA